MGWTFGWKTKKALLDKLVENQASESYHSTVVASKLVGDNLWTVKDIATRDFNGRVIHLDLIEKNGDWGYKDLSEGEGPYFFNCPLEFLDLAPEVANGKWRDYVRAYHAARRKKGTS